MSASSKPDARSLGRQCQGEVHGYGRLADAALAGRDGDQVVGSRQRLQPVLNGMRHDRADDRDLERRAGERGGAVQAQSFDRARRRSPPAESRA